METKKTSNRICLFCGKEREIQIFEDDGMDWLGHHRGRVGSRIVDSGCTCPFVKIEHENQEIKNMCRNCKSYSTGSCVNKNMVNEVSSFFQMPKELRIKHPDNYCKYWEINLDIFKGLLKKN